MSMGAIIRKVQNTIDNNQSLNLEQIKSIVGHKYGDMFVPIAEEYYNDFNSEIDYSEVYDVDDYENLLEELREEGFEL